ncbi:hypothetical protein PM082_006698 [Marasmius tenuissimus]|nr:hypothetical protein PM082_006698 [Marasmius tenuissimus]
MPGSPVSLNHPSFIPVSRNYKVTREEVDGLRDALMQWRHTQWLATGSSWFWSEHMILPPKQLEALASSCGRFLEQVSITVRTVQRVLPLDMIDNATLESLVKVILTWRKKWHHVPTPRTDRQRPRLDGEAITMSPLDFGPSQMAIDDDDVFGSHTPSTPHRYSNPTHAIAGSPYYRETTLDSSPSRRADTSQSPTSYYRSRHSPTPRATQQDHAPRSAPILSLQAVCPVSRIPQPVSTPRPLPSPMRVIPPTPPENVSTVYDCL